MSRSRPPKCHVGRGCWVCATPDLDAHRKRILDVEEREMREEAFASRENQEMNNGFKVAFAGNLGSAPEVSSDGKDGHRVKLSVAVQQDKETTEWVGVTAYGKFVDFLQRADKGDRAVILSGTLTTREDEKGKKYLNVQCQAQDILVIPKGAMAKGSMGGGKGGSDVPF